VIIALAVPFAIVGAAWFMLMFSHTSSAHAGSAVNNKGAGGFWGAYFSWLTNNPLTTALDSGVDWVLKSARGIVSHWALAGVKPLTRWLDGLNELHRRTYSQMAGLANDTAHGFQVMRHVVIPREVAKGVAPVATVANHASKTANTAVTRTTTLTETFTTTHRAQVKLNVRYSHAIDVAIPQQLGRINTRVGTAEGKIATDEGRIGALEDGAAKTWDWIRTHPLSAASAAFTGAVAFALSRLGFGFLRCRSWQNVGKGITCNMGNELGSLLGLAATAAVISDFRDLVKIAQEVERETVVGIKDLAGL
jgi:hypothetical protein